MHRVTLRFDASAQSVGVVQRSLYRIDGMRHRYAAAVGPGGSGSCSERAYCLFNVEHTPDSTRWVNGLKRSSTDWRITYIGRVRSALVRGEAQKFLHFPR